MDQQQKNQGYQMQPAGATAATFNELLISEVRSHPQLYDQQHRVCTDNGERNAIWEVIAERIDESVNGEFAKKRWLQMRDRYRKELKMALRTSIPPKWPYFTKLSWLDPYLKDAKTIKSGSNTPLNQSLAEISSQAGDSPFAADTKDFLGEHLRFPQFYGTVNMLETLLAASTALLAQQHKPDPGHFSSPDSAVASTSEDGGEQQQNQGGVSNSSFDDCYSMTSTPMKNAKDDESMECNETNGEEEMISSLTSTALSAQQQQNNGAMLVTPVKSSAATLIDYNSLFAANSPIRLFAQAQQTVEENSGTNAGSRSPLSLLGTPSQNNHHGSQRVRAANNCNSRNNPPPYLVRRGGSGIAIGGHSNKLRARLSIGAGVETANPLRKSELASVCPNVANNSSLDGRESVVAVGEDITENDDEDLLFARLVVARLKKLNARERRTIRSRILDWLDKKEEEAEQTESSVAGRAQN